MLDDFMRELFAPAAGTGALDPMSEAGTGQLATLAGGGGMDAPTMAPGAVPMPRPRPDVESILAGNVSQPTMDQMTGQPPAVAPPNLMDRLSGMSGPSSGMPPIAPSSTGEDPANGLLGRLTGMTGTGEKRFRNTIAGGFAGGNPAFAGGALMKGVSGGLSGGLKSDKEDTDAAVAAEKARTDRGFKDRAATTAEKNGEALRKLYGQRGDALATNAAAATARAANGTGKTPWNKPAHERYKDAQRLIIDKEKTLKSNINPMLPKADREAAQATAAKELDDFKKQTYKAYGLDSQGNDTGTAPSTGKTVGEKEGVDSGIYEQPGTMVGTGTQDDPYVPTTQEHFDALKPGSLFVNPADGKVMRKKGQQTSAADDTSGEEAA